MNVNKTIIIVISLACLLQKAYCPYTEQYIINQLTNLKTQLTRLKDLLGPIKTELPLQKKVEDFFNAIKIDQIPSGLIYELYAKANIIPSQSQEELNVTELTDLEKQAHKQLLQEFSGLIEEIDKSSQQSALLTFLRGQLEKLLQQVSASQVSHNHKKLHAKIKDLIETIDKTHYPTEILRKILESLRVLPIVPAREEPLELSDVEKQQEKDVMAQHAAIMRAIQKKQDKDKLRKEYIDQLKKAYSEIHAPLEQERPLPPLPSEPKESEGERELPALPKEEIIEVPKPEEKPEGTIPPPPPLPEKKQQLSDEEKAETRKALEERLKEAAENLKKIEQEEPQEKEKKESEWDEILKKALEERRSSIQPGEEEQEENEEEAEWEYNPWE